MNVSKKLSTLAVALLSMGLNKAAEATQDLDKFPVCKGYSKDKDLVIKIQEKLTQYGYTMEAGPDGNFGGQTKQAVINFQKENNIEQSGCISLKDFQLLTEGSPKEAPPKRIIVAIGDSITAQKYLNKIKSKITNAETFSYGYIGQGAKFIYGKLDEALKHEPEWIIIMAGVNDIASGRSVKHTKEYLEKLYSKSKESGAKVMAIEILPWHKNKLSKDREERTHAVNKWIREQEGGLVDEVVLAAPMVGGDPKKYHMNKEYTDDSTGTHPNDRGKEVLSKMVSDKIIESDNKILKNKEENQND